MMTNKTKTTKEKMTKEEKKKKKKKWIPFYEVEKRRE